MDIETAARKVKTLAAEGELLAAVDFARRQTARLKDPEDRHPIQIEEVVALARMASLEEAQALYDEYGLERALDSRAQSLKARFKKDVGFSVDPGSPDRIRLLTESRDAYLDIAREHDPDGPAPNREQYEYNAINAVSLSAMIERMDDVADMVEKLFRDDPESSYWSWATRAELLLATGAPSEAVADALRTATAQADALTGYRASTMTQLDRIRPGHPALDVLRPGPVLHYSGHIIAPRGAKTGRVLWRHEAELTRRIHAALDALQPSEVFGSLAAGADIVIVEWALAQGRDAHVYLPFGRKHFLETSVAGSGAKWRRRALACMRHERCRVAYLTHDAPVEGDDWAFHAVSRASMGAAIIQANRVKAAARQLLVWDGEISGGVAGASADRAIWDETGLGRDEVLVGDLGAKAARRTDAPGGGPARVPKALIFGDVKNFSKLGEAQLPEFVETVMGAVRDALAATTGRYGADALSFSNTWGDGVFAVFDTAAPAAFFALDLQDRMAALTGRFGEIGLPPDLAIRLGLHYGVVYPLVEPVTGSNNYFGEAVARAARIEPVTKAGKVFVSEEFAAALALDPRSPAMAEYVGEVDTAKKYGRFRLYRIRAKQPKPA